MASVAKRKWTHRGVTKEAWVVRYKDKGGAHRSRQFDLKKDADSYRRQVENEIDSGTHVARSESRTVAQAIDEYLDDIARRHREGKCGRGYKIAAASNLAYAEKIIGGLLIRDLTWQSVEAYYHELQRTKSNFGKPLSKTTIVNFMSQLGTMIGFSVRRGYAARNVVTDAKREIGSSAPDRIATFTRAEVKALMVALENYEQGYQERVRIQMRAMVYLAAACGLRKGEIAGLTWDAIDVEQGVVHVRQSLTPYDELKPPKTRSSVRSVPLPVAVAAALDAYRPHVVADDRGLIFRSRRGGEIIRFNMYRGWWRFLDRAGLPRRHFHALRHFAGSAWLDAGLPLTEVSRLLGHASPAVTAQVYAHAISDTNYRPPEVSAAAALIAPPIALIAQEMRKAA